MFKTKFAFCWRIVPHFSPVGTRYLTTQLSNGEKKKSPSLHLKISVIAVKRLQAESRENIGVQITKGSQIKTTTNNWMKPLEGIDHSSSKKKKKKNVCSLCSCWDIFTKLQRVRCVIAVSVCVCVSLTVHISVLQTRLTAASQTSRKTATVVVLRQNRGKVLQLGSCGTAYRRLTAFRQKDKNNVVMWHCAEHCGSLEWRWLRPNRWDLTVYLQRADTNVSLGCYSVLQLQQVHQVEIMGWNLEVTLPV